MTHKPHSNAGMSRFSSVLLVIGILLIAANLRAPFTGVALCLNK
ncbi:hypothetical protein P4S68_17340 [Pseudoalteromonas sp. Hal099]